MRVLVAEDVARLANDIAEGLRDQGMAVDVSYDASMPSPSTTSFLTT